MPRFYTVFLGTFLLISSLYSQNNKTAPAHVDTPIPVMEKEKITPHPDINVALQNDVDFLQKKFDQLGVDKGYDETAGLFLHQVAPMFDHVRTLVGRTLVAKDIVRQTQTHIADLQEQLKKEQNAVSDFETQASAVVDHIKMTLHKVDEIAVGDPEHYPERCGVMVSEDVLRKEGLESHQGIVEQFNKKWVLTIVDSSSSDGVKRLALDETVGLTGSKDHNAGLYATSLTPENMFVTGLYNPNTQTVVCVSQPQHVPSQSQVHTSSEDVALDKDEPSQKHVTSQVDKQTPTQELSSVLENDKKAFAPATNKPSSKNATPKESNRKVTSGH